VEGSFLFLTASRLTVVSSQPSIQAVAGAFPLEVKWPRHEADYPHLSTADVKNVWSHTSTPHTSSWHSN